MKVNLSNLNFRANRVSLQQAEYFKKALKNSKNVDVICHTGTDTDSAASAVVMASYLAQMGVKSKIIASKDISTLGVINPNEIPTIKEKELSENETVPDTVLCVDFSSKDRVSDKTMNLINKSDKLLLIDHHRGTDIVDHDYTYINSPLKTPAKSVTSCYVDSSAKSATSIIYRIFEALGEDIDEDSAYNLFLGLADDADKRGYLNCSAETGTISPSKDAYEDTNFIEVYQALRKRLKPEQIEKVTKAVDRTANLTPAQKDLQNFLYENVKITPDKKIAYVEIAPDNELWRKAGGDTPTVSTIMNKFRQDILANEDDERFKDLEIAMVFYRANGNYRVSLHSKNVSLHPVYKYVEDNCPAKNVSIGGHTTRGGGRITATDKESCRFWISQVLEACEHCV